MKLLAFRPSRKSTWGRKRWMCVSPPPTLPLRTPQQSNNVENYLPLAASIFQSPEISARGPFALPLLYKSGFADGLSAWEAESLEG